MLLAVLTFQLLVVAVELVLNPTAVFPEPAVIVGEVTLQLVAPLYL